jgi:hypothetical protein
VEEDDINPIQGELANLVNNSANMDVNIPAQFEPMVPLEIQEDDLMNDAKIQQQIEEEAA